MIEVRVLPSALRELKALARDDQRRVVGVLRALERGQQTGEPCVDDEDTIIRRVHCWHYTIVFALLSDGYAEVTEIGSEMRATSDRVDEVHARMINLDEKSREHALLRDGLRLLQPTA